MELAADEEAESGCSMPAALHEVRQLLSLGWPLSLNQLLVFAPRPVLLVVVGHYCTGAHVAAAGVGIMYSNFTGQALVKGTAFGAAPLLSQAHGARRHCRVGELLHRLLLLHLATLTLVSAPLALAARALLVGTGQPAHIAADAHLFILWRLAGLPFYAAFADLTAYCAAQARHSLFTS